MGSIAIVGLGDTSGDEPFALPDRVREADTVVVPSGEGELAEALSSAGVGYTTLAELGLSASDGVDRIIEGLVGLSAGANVVYVASAFPFLKEGLVSGLLARSGREVDVFPVLSPLQVILMAFDIDLTADLDIVDARSLAPGIEQRDSHLIVTGVGNRILARRVSERLADIYPLDHRVVVAGCVAGGGFSLNLRTVEDLAELETCSDAVVYVSPSQLAPPAGFSEFVRLIGVLRAPDGCPWDRAQNHLSLRQHMLEEAYEAVAAIEAGSASDLADELGDVLLQVVLHAQIASETGDFDIDEVVARITEKIRRRHPHIFGDASADTPDEVTANWSAIKRGEKEGGLLDTIPRNLPALMLAQKISRRVVGVGFEWETLEDVWAKVHEELDELRDTEPGSPEAAEEIGDVLFTVVNLARKQGIDAEEALRATCAKFTGRWEAMERAADAQGFEISSAGIERLEQLWQDAKKHESRD